MRWRHALIVAQRDLLDVVRQRSVWALLLLVPLVNVSFLLIVPGLASQREQQQLNGTGYTAAVEGGPAAAPVVATLIAHGVGAGLSRSAADAVAHRRVDVGVRIGNDGHSAEVVVLSSRARSRAAGAVVGRLLEERSGQLTAAELRARGLPLDLVDPFAVERVDLTTSGRGRRLALASSLPLLVLLPLSGVIGLSSQRISGSKDRRVFEPLLVLPITRASLIAGKGLSGLGLGLITMPAVILPLVLGRFVPVSRAGRTVAVAPATLVAIVAVALVLLVVLVGIGIVLGAAARTSTELSTVLQVVTLPIFLLGLLLQLRSEIPATAPLLLVPVFGALLLVREVASGTVQLWQPALVVLSSAVTATVLVAGGSRLLDRETTVLRPSS